MDPFEADALASPQRASSSRGVIEATGVSAVTFALCVAAHPEDPMAITAAFPWPVLGVALVGLRYGFPLAMFSALLLHVFYFLYLPALANAPEFTFAYSVGFAVMCVLTGEYRESWERRLGVVERSNAYRQARLEEFTQTYHVLKLSHDRLEQDNAGNQTSLRSALLTVRGLFVPGASLAEHAEPVLDIFRRFCAVVSGGLYAVDESGAIVEQPLAAVGTVNGLNIADPLITAALQNGKVASVNPGNPEAMTGRRTGDALIAVPFFDSYKQIHAVLVVTELPFFSYTERTLQLMAILAGQIADFARDLHTFPAEMDIEAASFVSEILRSLEYAQKHKLTTTLVAIDFADQTSAPAFLETIDRQSRGLDKLLAFGETGQLTGLLNMPLTGDEEYGQFLPRFEKYILEAHGAGPGQLGISNQHFNIGEKTTPTEIAQFLDGHLGEDNPISRALISMSEEDQAHAA